MLRLFIVEDDENIREGLKCFCDWREMGIEAVGSAPDGKAGLEQILSQNVDIVLTDVKMPCMSGLEMAKELRKAGWNGALVFLSAYSEIENLKGAIRVSADDYLLKPIEEEQLHEAIQSAIRKLEQRLDYQQLLRYERWNRLLRGEADDIRCGPYAVSLVHAPNGLEEILNELQRSPGILWADKLSATEVAVIWIEVADAQNVEEKARRFQEMWNQSGIETSWLTSEPTAESWRITAKLKRLQDRFSLGTVGTITDETAEPESLDALTRHIYACILSGSDEVWVESRMTEIWSRLCRCGSQTLLELQGNSIVLLQMLTRMFSAESQREFCERWQKKTCMMLLECRSAKELCHVIHTGLKTLHILVMENADAIDSLNRLRRVVMENLQEVSLALLVEKSGLSKWSITKIIRNECGLSVNEWIQGIRMEEARRMLLETDMKVYEISRIVGYISTDYFSGLFRSRHGTTPEKYRKISEGRRNSDHI